MGHAEWELCQNDHRYHRYICRAGKSSRLSRGPYRKLPGALHAIENVGVFLMVGGIKIQQQPTVGVYNHPGVSSEYPIHV